MEGGRLQRAAPLLGLGWRGGAWDRRGNVGPPRKFPHPENTARTSGRIGVRPAARSHCFARRIHALFM